MLLLASRGPWENMLSLVLDEETEDSRTRSLRVGETVVEGAELLVQQRAEVIPHHLPAAATASSLAYFFFILPGQRRRGKRLNSHCAPWLTMKMKATS